jgi:DNA-directed RNA polymerase beta subunit
MTIRTKENIRSGIYETFEKKLENNQWRGVLKKEASTFDVQKDDVDASVDTILAATEKILAINRGVAQPDERDSLRFRRLYPMDRLISERIALDADKLFLKTMRRVIRQKSLKPINVNHFDKYTENLIVGNPLSMPLEEINPLHLIEQARRVTQMGPGGLGEDSITEEAQNLHPSEFGFLSALEGPESERIGVDTRIAWGAKIGSDGNIYQKFLNKKTGRREWLNPTDLGNKIVGLPQ